MKVIYERDLEGSNRVRRGGGWYSLARYCRAAIRHWGAAPKRIRYLGLRPIIRIRRLG